MRRSLERILSKAGVCSRLEARRFAADGRVRVDGVTVRDALAWFDDERAHFEVDGRRLERARQIYLAFHKPRGCVTTRSDPEGRATVYDLLHGVDAWVVPVGRLDLDTSGLLLFTNDTNFADAITSPSSGVEKVYRVEARPRLSVEAFEALRQGLVLSDGPARPSRVSVLFDSGPRSVFEIALTEGRNREVRRLVSAVGSKVDKLERLSIGPLRLGELKRGAHRELTPREVRALIASAKR